MKLIGNLTLLICILFSQPSFSSDDVDFKPIQEVTPYVESDSNTVIVFFKFGCPACRMFHDSLIEWGKTLPKKINFQFYPIIEPGPDQKITPESLYGLRTFWVAEKIGNTLQKKEFAYEAYFLVQDEHEGKNKERWFNALENQGMKKYDIAKAWQDEIKMGDARVGRQLHYNPTHTPSLVICGKSMISPMSASDDISLFTQLANGLVSRCGEELGIKF
jgi:thiol-disulfide isomerase/thioredoxin